MKPPQESLPLAVSRAIDSICDRFEARWKAKRTPRIELFVTEISEPWRPVLVQRLIQLDVEYRRKAGEHPRAESYKAFPGLDSDWLAGLLPAPPPEPTIAEAVPSGNDRNLLVGILALQVDLISRDALIAAMHAWVLAKSKSLGQILQEQGALGADDQKVLEILVNKHIERHDNDAEKSLASIGLLGSVRQELEQIEDSDVQSSVAHVAAPRPAQDDAEVTEMDKAPRSVGTGVRFRNPKFFKSGGLGVVFEAHDEELHRKVALKEIRAEDADDEELRKRFVHEAEITGMLEHPGIVPVYGLGRYANGRPYYAMRFIEGETLKDAIEEYHRGQGSPQERNLVFRQLLGRFITVCETIAYAHSRGVLHRDLKPGNIMLGKYGETLVVDWGLAKSVGREDTGASHATSKTVRPPSKADMTPTGMGDYKGTLQFMSPEQAGGSLDLMGPKSDVYSLGATLFILVTGSGSVPGESRSELLQNIRRGHLISARQANKQTPAALAAICAKAMAFKLNDRYASALELAKDIEHWLADQPVQAWREPLRLRVFRWMRRHRSVVLGGIALLISAVIALTISTILVIDEQRKTQIALDKITEQEKQTEAARENTLKALDMLAHVAEETLPNTPGMREKQEQMLREALKLRETLFREAPRGAAMEDKLASDHHRLATGLHRLGELNLAEKQYKIAIKLLEKLGDVDPENLNRLAVCHSDFGEMLRVQGDQENARSHFQAAHRLQESLLEKFPHVPKYHLEAARIANNLGLLAIDDDDAAAARDAFCQALCRLRLLRKADGRNRDCRSEIGRVLVNLGVLHGRTGKLAEAEKSYGEAIQELEQVRKDSSTKYEDLGKLAVAYNDLGELVMRQDPDPDREALWNLAVAYNNLRHPATRPGPEWGPRFHRAEKLLQDAVDLTTRLAIDFPRNHFYRRELGRSLYNLGRWHWDLGECEEMSALVLAASTSGLMRPTQGTAQLVASSAPLSVPYHDAQPFARARHTWLRARDIWAELANDNPRTPEDKHMLGTTLHNLGLECGQRKERRAKDLEEAVQYLNQAIAAQKAALDADKKNSAYRGMLGSHYRLLADTLLKQKNAPAVERAMNDLLDLFPGDPVQAYKAAGYLGRCVPLSNDFAVQDAYAVKAIKLLRGAAAKLNHADLHKDSAGADSRFFPIRSHPQFQGLLHQTSTNKKQQE